MSGLIRIDTQEALRSFLASIVESSDDAIIGTTLDGRILSWNRGAGQIYGYSAEEIIGRALAVLALPERFDEVPRILEKVHRGERVKHFETMHLCKNGQVISVSLSISPVVDAPGRIIGVSCIARDVSRRIRYQESLREAEQKYRLLFTAGTDAILVTDAETGQVVDYNEAALRLYDYPPEAFSRLNIGDLVMTSEINHPASPVETPPDSIVRIPQERHRKRDGTIFPAEMSTSAFVWKGRPLQVGIVRDISEQQRIRELRQSLLMASEIQRHLLPRQAPELAGFDITAESRYCETIGGDYYDFVPLPEEGPSLLGCVVGDVSGHGIAAALLMAMAKGVLRAEIERFGGDLSGLFLSMNGLLARNINDDRFVTLFFGVLDAEKKTLCWNSAAHGPVFWYRRREAVIEELSTTGPPLGAFENSDFKPRGPIRLESGDVVLIGTDGIWEARNPAGEMFGTRRLRQVLATWADKPAAAIHGAVMEKVQIFCGTCTPEDDMTLMIVKVR